MHKAMPVIMSGLLLGMFGVIGAGLVGISHDATAARIAANERQAMLDRLHVLLPPHYVDNDLLADAIEVSAPEYLGAEVTRVYRARRDGEPFAAVFSPVVTQGYSGAIRLIVAIHSDGTLAGARVLSHRETPGLGDKVEVERSPWMLSFAGRSLTDPPPAGWRVKRDGGVFDQFTGATITPRAVVKGVKSTLDYFADHRDGLFIANATSQETNHE
jgi:electron transport complex protein RnfG